MSNDGITSPLLVILSISVISFSYMLIRSLSTGHQIGLSCCEPRLLWCILPDIFPGLAPVKHNVTEFERET